MFLNAELNCTTRGHRCVPPDTEDITCNYRDDLSCPGDERCCTDEGSGCL